MARRWAESELAALGTASDAEIADKIGRTEAAVKIKRCKVDAKPRCEVCGNQFDGNSLRTVCDDDECRKSRWRRWNRENYARNRQKMIERERERKRKKKEARASKC